MSQPLEEAAQLIEAAEPGTVHLLQLTDCHIFAEPDQRLLGLDTRDSLEQVCAAALRDPQPADLVLATGDLSQDGSAESYRYLAGRFARLESPVFWIAGNHDDATTMASQLQGENIHPAKQILVGNWIILLLDSTVPGEVHGRVAEQQLELVDEVLARYRDRHALVVLHHQAQLTGSQWIDDKGLRDADGLRARLLRHPNLRGVLWGHVHQEYHRRIGQVDWMSTPSTCVQFLPGSVEFAADKEAPGYRRLQLHEGGRIETRVERIAPIDFEIDYSLRG